MNETKEGAETSFQLFTKTYEAKYPKATECLEKDRDSLMAFYDFPAEPSGHIRTTNPIESTCATVKLRTAKTRGCFLEKQLSPWSLNCEYRLKRHGGRKFRGSNRVAEVIRRVDFVNQIAHLEKNQRMAA
jgi:hypothetical protein